jgi:hypothetical protein
MGRSFDRGGRSRKERERGKRRAYLHAERDKEARNDVFQAKRMATGTASTRRKPHKTRHAEPVVIMETVSQATPAIAVTRKPSGLLSQFFNRIFKKKAA